MSRLQVEELESRQLLNSPGIFSQSPFAQTLEAFSHSLMTAERALFVDYEDHIGAFAWGWSDGARADMSPLRIIFSVGPGGRDPLPPGPVRQEARAWLEI